MVQPTAAMSDKKRRPLTQGGGTRTAVTSTPILAGRRATAVVVVDLRDRDGAPANTVRGPVWRAVVGEPHIGVRLMLGRDPITAAEAAAALWDAGHVGRVVVESEDPRIAVETAARLDGEGGAWPPVVAT